MLDPVLSLSVSECAGFMYCVQCVSPINCDHGLSSYDKEYCMRISSLKRSGVIDRFISKAKIIKS